MPLFPELSHRPAKELMRWFSEPDHDKEVPDGDLELWLGEVASRIAKNGIKGVDFLLSCIPSADDFRLRSILVSLSLVENQLSSRKRGTVCTRIRPFLYDARPIIVAETVDALSHLSCPGTKHGILPLLNHSSPYVVGSVLRFLARHFPEEAVPLLEQALDSEDPIIRQNGIDELDDLHYLPALPRIRQLLKDDNKYVREAAITAVMHLEEAEGNLEEQ
jgi:hypothetical protein